MKPQLLSVALTGEAIENGEVSKDDLAAAIAAVPLLRVIEDVDAADIRVVAQAQSVFRLYERGQTVALAAFRIPVKRLRSLHQRMQRILEQVAAYRNLAALQAPESYLADTVKIQFLQLLEPATRGSLKEPAATPLERNEAGEYQLEAGQNLTITFTHFAPDPLYFYVVSLDRRLKSTALIYPYKSAFSARIKPSDPLLLVGAGPEYLLEMQVPEGYSSGLDIFKILVSQSAIEPDILNMPSLGTRKDVTSDYYGSGARLDRELRLAILGQAGTSPLPQFFDDPWWATEERIRVLRA
ncbi:hypothetical protein [Synechococcus sp. PCC 7336]|uniref:hypothetical protein n=1 Tax=Synechococcus sp. PCC 7336 TaxID=195250 RepID=UPI0012E9E58B|nr:hypothetical protein [Synechococcus sp. PCC 7336]